MTTFQDPPYQSRRAVRQNGRVDDVEVDAPVRPATSRTGRRAQLPSSTEWNTDDSPNAEGRTDAPSAPAPAEPLTLATPLQPQMPVYDAVPSSSSSLDTSSASTSAPSAPQGRRASLGTGERHPATSAIPTIAMPAPEVATATTAEPASDGPSSEPVTTSTAESVSANAASHAAESAATDAPVDVAEPAVLDDSAELDEPAVSPAPIVVTVPEAAAPADEAVVPEPAAPAVPTDRPMTRRELREARVAAERAAERAAGAERASSNTDVPEAIVSILNSGPIILPYLSTSATPPLSAEDRASAVAESSEQADALAEFEALTSEHTGDDAPIGAQEHPAAPASTWAMPLEPSSASESAGEPESVSSVQSSDDVDEVAAPPVTIVEAAPAQKPADEDADDDVIDPSDKAEQPAPITVPEFIEPGQTPVSNRGAGHWSVSADTNGDLESLENTITRSVGAGSALTTSALVLPSIPQSSESPYLATGETMLTGSVDLPRSLGSTGVHPSQIDNSDFDHDPLDREVPSTDSAPVRAIRAVSTHTSSNGLITSKKPQGNHMLTVLVVSSSALAVVVVGLLVAGVSSGLFQ
jgi:hypothetical protein